MKSSTLLVILILQAVLVMGILSQANGMVADCRILISL